MSYARTNPPRPARPTANAASGEASGAPVAQSRELQHHGAYAVKAPDPAKREKIQRVANAETKAYEQHQQNKKHNVRYVTTNAAVGTVSSSYGSSSVESAPRRQSSLPSYSANPGAPKLKPTSLRSQTTRMEDPEIERRKAVQRQKAEALQSKQNSRQDKLDRDMRSKNNKFLDRLEGRR